MNIRLRVLALFKSSHKKTINDVQVSSLMVFKIKLLNIKVLEIGAIYPRFHCS